MAIFLPYPAPFNSDNFFKETLLPRKCTPERAKKNCKVPCHLYEYNSFQIFTKQSTCKQINKPKTKWLNKPRKRIHFLFDILTYLLSIPLAMSRIPYVCIWSKLYVGVKISVFRSSQNFLCLPWILLWLGSRGNSESSLVHYYPRSHFYW